MKVSIKVSTTMAVLTVVSTLVYLVAVVALSGGWSVFAQAPARVVTLLVVIVMALAALMTEGNVSPGEREDRGNRWVLGVFGALGIVSAVVPPWCDHHAVWVVSGEGWRWVGVALFAAGGALRMWPVFVLGRRFSGLVAIQPGHTLVTDGIYRLIRNPSYLGLIVNGIGWALVFRSMLGVVLAFAYLVPLVARIRAEESLLREHFGAAYETYCRHTWRLVPGLY